MNALRKYEAGIKKLRIDEVDIPEPGEGEVRVKVKYAGVCGTDIHIYLDDSYPTRPPVILGHELSGIIDKNGSGSSLYSEGDRVVCETYYHTCGSCRYCRTGHENLCLDKLSIGSGVDGAFAEYLIVPEKRIHRIPANIGLEEAALTEPLACCVQAVYEQAGLLPGDNVLITGPGTIGLLCLQVVKAAGCKATVLGTETDVNRLELAKELGADEIVVTDSSVMEKLERISSKEGFSCVFECSGAEAAISTAMNVTMKGGTVVQVGLTGKPVNIDANLLTLKEIKYVGTYAQKWVWWDKAIELLGNRVINLKPFITEILPLESWEKAFKMVIENKGFKILFRLG